MENVITIWMGIPSQQQKKKHMENTFIIRGVESRRWKQSKQFLWVWHVAHVPFNFVCKVFISIQECFAPFFLVVLHIVDGFHFGSVQNDNNSKATIDRGYYDYIATHWSCLLNFERRGDIFDEPDQKFFVQNFGGKLQEQQKIHRKCVDQRTQWLDNQVVSTDTTCLFSL